MIGKVLPLLALALSAPAAAEVYKLDENGFVLRHAIEVPATPERSWETFVNPSKWWNAKDSYSHDAANLSLDLRAGGCFCEVLPNPNSPNAAPRGSAEHMRVVYVERPRALRMRGALGPLQSGPAQGMLTVIFQPAEGGTRILMEYAVGGVRSEDARSLATDVDLILGDQVMALANVLGGKMRVAPTASPPGEPPAAPEPVEPKSDFDSEMRAILQDTPPEKPEPAAPAPAPDGAIDYDLRNMPANSEAQGEYVGR